ncbi:hypothetical protein P9Z80_25925 [Bacillus cereus]|nr:hypothetical protein [Bacillus cereus]MEC3256724.1 hypothetical protein [Bacillus cereus]
MVRKIRYRQVLRNRHSQKGRYLKEVSQQQSFWKEDKAPTPTIEKVRELHTLLGTWDKDTCWDRWVEEGESTQINKMYIGEITLDPMKNYKEYTKFRKRLLESRLREQERRTLEFFEREGC